MSPAHFLIFALQCLFPIFDTTAGDYTGVSIVNRDAQSREYTVTATASSGIGSQSGKLTLNAGTQRAFLLNEVVGASVPSAGSIRIDSEASGCTCYMANGNDQMLAGTDAEQSGALVVWLPHISINTGFAELGHTETQVSIVSVGAAVATVPTITIDLIGLDGVVKGTQRIPLPANASRFERISELFRDVLPNNNLGGKVFEGYARLSAEVPFAAWQRIDTPLSRSLLRGIPATFAVSSAVIPHFVFGGGFGYDSILNIVNPGPGTNVLELRAFDDRGNAVGESVQLTLRAGEAKRAPVGELFRFVTIQTFPPPLITGYISIRPGPTAQPAATPFLGSLEILARAGPGKTASMLVPFEYSNATDWTLPFAASAGSYFSGYVVAHVSQIAAQADVQVDVFNSSGQLVDRKTLSVSPGRRETGLIPPGVSSGYVRVTSNLPVYVAGAIGKADLQVLDQLPAIPR